MPSSNGNSGGSSPTNNGNQSNGSGSTPGQSSSNQPDNNVSQPTNSSGNQSGQSNNNGNNNNTNPSGYQPVPDSSGNQTQSSSGNQSHTDSSGNQTQDASGNQSFPDSFSDSSGNQTQDISWNVLDMSCNDTPPYVNPIITDLSINIIDGVGYEIVNSQGLDASGSIIIRTTFNTTDPSANAPQISETLSEVITTYNDETDPNSQTDILLSEIRLYASQIQCDDFHGKGSIDDYTALFQAAGKIATESKQMELDIDVEGFSEFAQAADDLSALFNGFITKLQNVNIITDITFLTSIANALQKIVNLSKVFGKFKETIFATSTIKIPKSAHDTQIILSSVMDEVNCAMQYINYFVNPTSDLSGAALTAAEQNIISKSVDTIDNWNLLCEQGVSIAMSTNSDVKYIQQASTELKQTTVTLKNVSATLKSKLAAFNILC